MNWDIAANIATVITSVSIFIALVQVLREVKGQDAQAFFYLHEYLSQNEFSDARKKLRTELFNKPYDEWNGEDFNCANKVCSSYDQAGILISSGIINKKIKTGFLSSSWGRSIIDQYEILTDFLDTKQTPTLTGREFFKHFTWLYNESKRYQEE